MRARRLIVVALLYLVGAAVVVGAGQELGAILVLPPLFDALLVILLLLGFVTALAVAWGWAPDVDEE